MITTKEAAKILDESVQNIVRRAKCGDFESARYCECGNAILYEEKDVRSVQKKLKKNVKRKLKSLNN